MYYGYELRFTEKLFNFMFEITIPFFVLLLLNLFYHRHVELLRPGIRIRWKICIINLILFTILLFNDLRL